MVKFNSKTVIVVLLLVCANFLYSQDLKLEIPATSINCLFQSFIEAGLIPEVTQPDQNSSFQYTFTPLNFELELPQDQTTNTFKLILEEGISGTLNYGSIHWTILPDGDHGVHLLLVLVGQISLMPHGTGFKVVFVPDQTKCSINLTFNNGLDAVLDDMVYPENWS